MKLLGQTVQKKWIKNTKNGFQGQRSRSNVTIFQMLPALTVAPIPTKLHQFLISSFRDFVRRDRRAHTQTPPKNNTCSQQSWHAGNYDACFENNTPGTLYI